MIKNLNVTRQGRKKRKAMYNAPLHKRRKTSSVHLGKDLRKSLKKRSVLVRKGDKVRVMVGEFAGASGLVTKVDYSRSIVLVEGVLSRLQSGREKRVVLQPSNLVILERSQKKV